VENPGARAAVWLSWSIAHLDLWFAAKIEKRAQFMRDAVQVNAI
jgi:hypothetical protein